VSRSHRGCPVGLQLEGSPVRLGKPSEDVLLFSMTLGPFVSLRGQTGRSIRSALSVHTSTLFTCSLSKSGRVTLTAKGSRPEPHLTSTTSIAEPCWKSNTPWAIYNILG